MECEFSEIRLIAVTQPHVPDWYEVTHELIAEACARSGGRWTLNDVLKCLLSGRFKLWVAMRDEEIAGIGISEIIFYPQLRECKVIAATGEDAGAWDHLILEIEEWAMTQGCRKMKLETRPGWKKPMAKYGYELTHVILEKDLGYVH